MPASFNVERFIAALLVICAGCTGQPRGRAADTPQSPPPPVSAAAAVPEDMSRDDLTRLIFDHRPQAEFHMGENSTLNFDLTLLAGGGYSVTVHGCEGLYGAAIGKWRLDGDRVALEPTDQQGWLAEPPLKALRVRLLKRSIFGDCAALVPDQWAASFVEPEQCFRPTRIVWSELSDVQKK